MTPTRRLQIIALITMAAVSSASGQGHAWDDRFRDIAAIEMWARQEYFGGALVTKYSNDGRELVVVNGMPTSGILTSQVVILGRASRNLNFHVILKSAVFKGEVIVREEKDGLRMDSKGKAVLYVPFDLVSLTVQTGL